MMGNVAVRPLVLAGSVAARAQGLLGVTPNDEVLLIMPCHDVHTFGMKDAIDIAFVGEDGRVVESHTGVGPRRRLRCGKAAGVMERFSSCEGPWFAEGERVVIACNGGEDR
jgi:uncharacterized protein